jgi:hypothetical protein
VTTDVKHFFSDLTYGLTADRSTQPLVEFEAAVARRGRAALTAVLSPLLSLRPFVAAICNISAAQDSLRQTNDTLSFASSVASIDSPAQADNQPPPITTTPRRPLTASASRKASTSAAGPPAAATPRRGSQVDEAAVAAAISADEAKVREARARGVLAAKLAAERTAVEAALVCEDVRALNLISSWGAEVAALKNPSLSSRFRRLSGRVEAIKASIQNFAEKVADSSLGFDASSPQADDLSAVVVRLASFAAFADAMLSSMRESFPSLRDGHDDGASDSQSDPPTKIATALQEFLAAAALLRARVSGMAVISEQVKLMEASKPKIVAMADDLRDALTHDHKLAINRLAEWRQMAAAAQNINTPQTPPEKSPPAVSAPPLSVSGLSAPMAVRPGTAKAGDSPRPRSPAKAVGSPKLVPSPRQPQPPPSRRPPTSSRSGRRGGHLARPTTSSSPRGQVVGAAAGGKGGGLAVSVDDSALGGGADSPPRSGVFTASARELTEVCILCSIFRLSRAGGRAADGRGCATRD